MSMNTFVLKNTHRFKALAFAVQRLDSRQTNPIYKRRELVVDDIVAQAWAILKEASLAQDEFADFVSSGLARRVDELDLGTRAPLMLGRYGMHSGTEIWPAVIENVRKGSLLSFDPRATTRVKAAGEIVSFHGLNGANLLPQATLTAALNLRGRVKNVALQRRQAALTERLDQDLAAINAEIVAVFKDLPLIAESIGQCHTSEELIEVFPAAEALFADATPVADPRAKQVLAAL